MFSHRVTIPMNPSTHQRSVERGARTTVRKATRMAKALKIMGLLIATLVTKVVVPVLYVLFVEDFRLIRWSPPGEHTPEGPPAEYTDGAAAVHGPGATTVGLR